MAIEKMLLVNVLGKLDTMDTAFERVCIDEDFHPESTLKMCIRDRVSTG